MSRHKNMKFITEQAYDDMLDEEYDDYYDDINAADLDQYVNQVMDMLGDAYAYDDIVYALKENDYAVDRAIDSLLNPPTEVEIVAAPKKQKKNKKGKKGKGKKGNIQNQNQNQNKPKTVPAPEGFEFPSTSNSSNNNFDDLPKMNRKRSNNFEKIARKMSNNENPVGRKQSKKFGEFFNDKIYGNVDYPEISYKFDESLLESRKNRATIVISGHVDSGKSTLLGQIMVSMKQVDKNILRKLTMLEERTNKQKGRSLAWIFDEREDEREKGITVDVNEKYLFLPNKVITFLDTPGHRDLVPKMISGASQCQFAMLIIDGERDNFMSGFDPEGQTREHAFLLNSVAPKRLIVVVNKMDMVEWSEDAFILIVSELTDFFQRENMTNFGSVDFIPVSALLGDNVVEPVGEKAAWWQGGTLLDEISSLESEVSSLVEKPFRMGVQASYESKEHGRKGYILSGRVEGGVIKKGDKLTLMPIDIPLTVKDLIIGDNKESTGLPGDIVDIIATLKDPKQWVDVTSGLTLSSLKYGVPVSSSFEAIIYLSDIVTPILKGTRCEFHFGPLSEAGIIEKLIQQKDPSTLENLKKTPRFLLSKFAALVKVKLDRKMCLELERNFTSLGKFQFRDRGRTLGHGRITKLMQFHQKSLIRLFS